MQSEWTFLFTDVEGSTALWEIDEDAMRAALVRHDELIRHRVARHGGIVFATGGDSFSVAFADAGQAVEAAVAVIEDLGQQDWSTARPLKVRIGLHTGEAEHRGGDFFGTTVNIAARVSDTAHGGQVVLTDATLETAPVAAVPLGRYTLRGLADALAIHQLADPRLATTFPPLRAPRLVGARVEVLGPVSATVGGISVDSGTPKQRLALAVLVAARGRAVSIDALIDAIWPDSPPVRARHSLQQYVSRLRRALDPHRPKGSESTVLAMVGAGYALHVDSDLAELEQLLAAADAAEASGQRDAALDARIAAEALWRGPVLSDLAGEPWADAFGVELEERRLAAFEDRARVQMQGGDTAGLAARLREIVAEHPLRERAWALLVQALGLEGRRAEALAAYDRARDLLVEELGLDPGEELQTAQRRVLQGPAAVSPAAQPVRASLGDHTLPSAPNRLIGRQALVEQARHLLDEVGLLTLVGPGGVGKTRLAVEVAHQVRADFADGAWFVPLAQVGRDDDVAQAVADVVGVRTPSGMTTVAATARALAGRELLLVLDNCEHVRTGARELATALADPAVGISLLLTTRDQILLPGGRVLAVPPLVTTSEVPDQPSAALELFRERVAAVDPSVDLDAAEGRLREICMRLDGVPLALELAAARVRGLGLEGLAQRLANHVRLLHTREETGRHAALWDTIAWSYDLLDEPLQELFCQAAVFTGGFTLGSAEAVLRTEQSWPGAVADGVAELVDRSMLQPVKAASGRRYRMLESMRQFGAERGPEQLAITRPRFVRACVTLAQDVEAGMSGPRPAEAFATFEDEVANFAEAVRLAWSADDVDSCVDLIVASERGAWMRVIVEPHTWAIDVLERLPPEHPRWLDVLGEAVYYLSASGDRDRAINLSERAMDTSGRLSPRAEGRMVSAFWFGGQTDRAIEMGLRAAEGARSAEDWLTAGSAMAILSMAQDAVDRPAARATAEHLLTIADRIASPLLRCMGLLPLAGTLAHDDLQAAIQIADELAPLADGAGSRWHHAAAVRLRAQYRSRAGRTDEAAALFADALRMNGVGDRGEMLWYTVLNIAEHLIRTDHPRVAALAVASYLQAPSAPRDALVERGLSRFTSTLREMLGAEEWRSVEVEAQALTLSAFLSRLQDELEGRPIRGSCVR